MANQWFRLYAEFWHDPKIQMMSEADQRRFVMLLCMRCSNGSETLQDSYVTFNMRISETEWNKTKAIFLSKNLIDSRNNPVAWDKRQFVSDSSTARVSKHRERKKQACNVSVTPPESDSESDKELTPCSAQARATPKKTARSDASRRRTQLPAEFVANETHRDLAQKLGVAIEEELSAFLDYHAAHGSIFSDWNRAFCTWLRNAKKFAGGKNGRRYESPGDRRAAYLAEVCAPANAGTFDGTAERLD